MKSSRQSVVIATLVLVLLLLAALSLTAGKVWVPWNAWISGAQDPRWAIIFELRLPRTLLGLVVGAALGLSGAAMQGYTRNPLADPGLLGVSAMAALGAVLTLYLGLNVNAPWTLGAAAIVGAMLGIAATLGLAGITGGIVTFILAGVVLNTLASAGLTLALSLAPNPWTGQEIVNWLMGSLADRSFGDLELAAPFITVGGALLLFLGPALDALTLGEIGANALGIDLGRVRIRLTIGIGLVMGAAVAVTGVIGFVGLIVPNLLRPVVGHRPGALLVPSALGGAVLVLAGDILVRLTPSASEVRLGVATAVLGGPFFLAMLISMRRRLA